jgi:hypothetical protein
VKELPLVTGPFSRRVDLEEVCDLAAQWLAFAKSELAKMRDDWLYEPTSTA